MPSNQYDINWFIRVTQPWADLQKSEGPLEKLKAWKDLEFAIIAFHVGDKTFKEHVHVVFRLTSPLQKQSINHRVKAVFGEMSKDEFSVKQWDGSDDVISYLYHDKKAVVEYHKMVMAEDRLAAILKVTAEKTPKNGLTFKQKGLKKLNIESVLERIALGREAWSMTQIAKTIATEMSEGRWPNRGKHQMAAQVEEIWLRQKWIDMDPEEKKAAIESVAVNWVRLLV